MKNDQTQKRLPSVQRIKAEELGQLIRGARIHRQWTQENLAERAGISVTTLKRLEKGATAISFAAVLMVCWLLDLPWKIDLSEGEMFYFKALIGDKKRARMSLNEELDNDF